MSDPPERPNQGTRPWGARIQAWLSHDTHWVIQFIKYGITGGLAFATDFLTYSLCAWKVFPVRETGDLNFTLSKTIAFMLAVTVAYFTNIRWVFKPGRHSRRKEVFYFFLVALLGFLPSTFLGQWMVNQYNLVGIKSLIPYVATVVFAVLFNYTGRKFFIFKH